MFSECVLRDFKSLVTYVLRRGARKMSMEAKIDGGVLGARE